MRRAALPPGIRAAGVVAVLAMASFAQAVPENPIERVGQLFRAGHYAEARDEADRQLLKQPNEVALLRLKGVCLIELGDSNGAAVVLQEALKKDPTNVASQFYLAQAEAYRGNISAAIAELKGIQKEAPDSDYAKKAANVLPDLEHLRSSREVLPNQRRWHLSLRAGTEYDDNVPARASSDSNSGPQGSAALVTSAYADYSPLDEKTDGAPLTCNAAYSIYQNAYQRADLKPFDLTSQTGILSFRKSTHLGTWPAVAQLSGQYTNNHLDGSPFDHEWGWGTNLALQVASAIELSASYAGQSKDFEEGPGLPSAYSRDGLYQTVGLTQTFFTFRNRVVWSIGYAYQWMNTTGAQFKSTSHTASASSQVALPCELRWNTSFQFENVGYTLFTPTPMRLDHLYTVSTGLSRPIFIESLTAELTFTHMNADSNQSFSQYVRNLYGLAAVWSY